MEDRAPAVASGERVEGESGVGPGSPSTPDEGFKSQELTPSGIEIRYAVEPKRKYEVRQEKYKVDWREVPSVSTITDLVKGSGALIWWGQGTGVDGVLNLFQRGILRASKLSDGRMVISCPARLPDGSAGLVVAGREHVVDLMGQYKLTTNHVKSTAGTRGQGAHDALELWAQNGEMPNPEMWPPEERGYIEGLVMFLTALEKAEPEVVASERMVGSVEHEFAGRYDIEVRTHKPAEIVKRWMPKRGPQYAELPPGLYVPDLKTSKYVMESHCIQLEGYEIGRVHSGYEPSDARGVIHVHPGDPKDDRQPDTPYYEFVKSWARPETFLATLNLYRELEHMKEEK